jgi:2,3-bisphosphoglycerate-independent phosphoglycerate mutase
MDLKFINKLIKPSKTKIAMLVIDGLGGLPKNQEKQSELELANTPNLDILASKGICGLQQPVGPGITPGSGPGHLSLFGYDPLKYKVGRGVLAAMGINFELKPGDIAARGNFCTIDENDIVLDRRAGRISTDKNKELCKLLTNIKIPNVEFYIETVKEHRFLIVMRGDNLSDKIIDTDPQEIGKKPLYPKALLNESEKTSELINQFLNQSQKILRDQYPANMILTRGFSQKPNWPSFEETFGLKSAAIASYPMYRGLARLLGMQILETDKKIEDEFYTLEKNWDDYDFFYIHVKGCDSAGEDGDFERKIQIIEEIDNQIPKLIDLKPDVIIVTGDHSTPSILKYHSWHPVPLLLWSKNCRSDNVKFFNENSCITGGLGPRYPAVDIMPLALANANRLEKYGA